MMLVTYVKILKLLALGLVLICHFKEGNSATCGLKTRSSSPTGYLSSPTKSGSGGFTSTSLISHTEYPNDQSCTYDIDAPFGKIIKLSWKRFDLKGYMPTCWPNDYVEIFIGCGRKSIGKYCSTNSQRPFDVYSPDNCLRIKFHSDDSDVGKGFLAHYQTFSKSTSLLPNLCGNYLKTGSYGTISSARWPHNYQANMGSCYWSIQVGKSKSVKIAFMDFDLESDFGCDDTKLKIKADDDDESYSKADKTVKDSICGRRSPFTVTSSEERVYIRFKTGYRNVNKRGFVAGYVLYEPSIHDTGSKVAIIVICIIVAIVVIGFVVFCYVRRRHAARGHHPPPMAMAPATQSYPTQPPPPAAKSVPPPSYGQATAGPYPPPGSYPPPGQPSYPPPGQPSYPPPGQPSYPPPGQPSYPPPGQTPYPPPGQTSYPPPGQTSYPPPEQSPYPPPAGQPYPAAAPPAYPPPGQAQPYPPPGQEKPYPPP